MSPSPRTISRLVVSEIVRAKEAEKPISSVEPELRVLQRAAAILEKGLAGCMKALGVRGLEGLEAPTASVAQRSTAKETDDAGNHDGGDASGDGLEPSASSDDGVQAAEAPS